MNAQINQIRQLVVDCLDLSADQISQWLADLPVLRDGICAAMRDEVFGQNNDRLVERHIRQIQCECISLMDLLAQRPERRERRERREREEIPENLLPVYEAAFSCLEEILACIERHHSRFFDQKAMVPLSYFQISAAEMGKKMNVLRAGLRRLGVDVDLLDIILNGLYGFLGRGGCSYEKLVYMKELQNSLISLCREADRKTGLAGVGDPGDVNRPADINGVIMEHLLYLRFNSCAFANYYKARLAAEITELFSAQEQFEYLCRYEKQMKIQQEKATCYFDPLNRNLRTVLQEYIKAELKYLEKKMSCFSLNGPPADLSKRLQSSSYRIKVSLSADAMAYLTRLFVEAGVIISKPRTQLVAFLARSIETPGIGDNLLSPVSLMNKYKQVVQSTVKAVRTVLLRMLMILEQRFGLLG